MILTVFLLILFSVGLVFYLLQEGFSFTKELPGRAPEAKPLSGNPESIVYSKRIIEVILSLQNELNAVSSSIKSLEAELKSKPIPASDVTRMKELEKHLKGVRAENEDLSVKIKKLGNELLESQNENCRHVLTIKNLEEEKKAVLEDLEISRVNLKKLNESLRESHKRAEELKNRILKQKIIHSQLEKEAEALRVENQDLRDGLMYEANN